MKNLCLYSALALALAMTAVHIFVGGRLIAAPLLASDLEVLPRLTLYLCWHAITVALAGLALLIADTLFWRRRAESALLAAGLAGIFTVINAVVIIRFGVSPLTLPQWIILGPLAATAFFGACLAQGAK